MGTAYLYSVVLTTAGENVSLIEYFNRAGEDKWGWNCWGIKILRSQNGGVQNTSRAS